MASSSLTSTDEVLFEFTQLASDLQRMAVLKLDLSSFSTLRKTSKTMRSVCDQSVKSGYLPPICFEYCNVYDVDTSCEHNNEFSEEIPSRPDRDGIVTVVSRDNHGEVIWGNVCEHYRHSTVRGRVLVVDGEVSCSPESFNNFLETHSIRELYLSSCSSDFNRFLHLPAVKKLSLLRWYGDDSNRVEPISSTLLSLTASTISLPRSDLEFIDSFLTEWRECRRDIARSTVQTVKCPSFPSRDELVSHLEHGILSRLNATSIEITIADDESDEEQEDSEDDDDSVDVDDADRWISMLSVLGRSDGRILDVFFSVAPHAPEVYFACDSYLIIDGVIVG